MAAFFSFSEFRKGAFLLAAKGNVRDGEMISATIKHVPMSLRSEEQILK